jgi:hypothetical protein
MELKLKETPRVYSVKEHQIKDCGDIYLEAGEQVTFVNAEGSRCDFAAKDWGYYLGPSVNGRALAEGFRTALVVNEQGRLYVNAVSVDKMEEFFTYLKDGQNSRVICWLDEWFQGK